MNKELVLLKKDIEDNIKNKERVVNILSYSRLIAFLIALVLYLIAPYKEQSLKYILYVIAIIATIGFIALMVIHQIKYNALDYMRFEVASINDYELRFNNKYQRFKDGGEEFKDSNNYYEYDLDLFCKASVYKYLNVSRTAYGRKALAFALKDKDTSEDIIRKRQEAVCELASDAKTHIELEAISRIYEKKVDDRRATSMDNALSLVENEVHVKGYEIGVGLLSNILVILSIVLACLKVFGYGYIAGAILISFLLNTYIISSIKEIRANVIPINNLFSGYDNYIRYIKQKSFKSEALNEIKRMMTEDKFKDKNINQS